jgi:hypothetical protein
MLRSARRTWLVAAVWIMVLSLGYFLGSRSVYALPACQNCTCKNLKAWNVIANPPRTYAWGMQNTGHPLGTNWHALDDIWTDPCSAGNLSGNQTACIRVRYFNSSDVCQRPAKAWLIGEEYEVSPIDAGTYDSDAFWKKCVPP